MLKVCKEVVLLYSYVTIGDKIPIVALLHWHFLFYSRVGSISTSTTEGLFATGTRVNIAK